MSDDLFWFTVLGLEEVKASTGRDTFEILKAPVLSRRTVESRFETSGAQTVEEALVLSLGWKGMIDLGYMSSLLGRSEAEVSAELLSRQLAYLNPATNRLETREDYLSGNVREKYERALALANEGDDRFKTNRSALEAVLPKDIPIEEIDCKLGAKWIAADCISRFMRDMFQVEAQIGYSRADHWKVEIKSGRASIENVTVYGSGELRAHEIIQRLLNQRSMALFAANPLGGPGFFDAVATAALEEKAVEIQQLFTQYARSNPAIARQIVRDFNAALNAHVPKTYSDGRHLRLPGFSNAFRRDQHQLQAVWRGLLEGGGLKAYETGSG
jgi:N12 class adenine-specific DNA methylase